MTSYEIRTTIANLTYPGCERRDATCATREEAEAAIASLVATGEWAEDDLEIVEVVLAPERLDAARAAGAVSLRGGRRLGIVYSGSTPEAADAAADALIASISAATGLAVTVVDSGPNDPGFWSVLAFGGRACDARGLAV